MTQREIAVRIKADVAEFTRKLAEASAKAKGFATDLGKASQADAFRQTSTGILAVGAAATAAGGLAVRAFADFDSAMSAVKATGDEARGSYDQLKQAAIDAGASTKFSATEAAQGMEALLKAGVSAEDVLGGGLKGSLDLAAAGNLDLATAAETASSAMTQFKLEGDDVGHIADVLAAGAGKAQGDVSDLAMGLKQSGLVAASFGLSLEETVGTLSAFASAGLLGSDAGTSFKAMLSSLANPSKESAALMEDLGLKFYDAQGKFIGVAGVADELKAKMAGLTDEQRQQAMAQLFGNDAVRAANALYNEGAAGIEKWTQAVNDSGYATEVARTLQDNLKGDLEKLGGSIETLLIQAGKASNGPLRGLIQGISGLLDAASQNPEALQVIAVGIGAVGAAALTLGGIMKAVTAWGAYRSALDDLGKSNARAAAAIDKTTGALGKAAKAAGLAGLAFGALQVFGEMQSHMDGLVMSADGMTAALTRARNGAGSIDEAFAGTGRMFAFQEGAKGVADAVRLIADAPNGAVMAIDNFVADLTGFGTEFTSAQDRMLQFDEALRGLSYGEATARFAEVRNAFEDQKVPIEGMLRLFPQYGAAVQAAAAQAGLAELSAGQLASALEGIRDPELDPAKFALMQEILRGTSDATTTAAGAWSTYVTAAEQAAGTQADAAVRANADAFLDQANAAQLAADSINASIDAMNAAASAALAASGSEMGLEAAYDAAAEAIAKNGETVDEFGVGLDRTTEKGRANQAALDQIASSAVGLRSSMIQAGDGVEAADQKVGEAREQFIKTAVAMGMNAGYAEQLADRYGLIPSDVTTTVQAVGAIESQAEADALNAALVGLPDETKAEIKTIAEKQGYEEAMAALDKANGRTAVATVKVDGDLAGYYSVNDALNRISGRTVTTYVAVKQYGQGAIATGGRVGDIVQLADGGSPLGTPTWVNRSGRVNGPGTMTSDSVRAVISRDEFVTRGEAARYYGYDLMYAMNAKRIPRELFRAAGFTDGGTPSRTYVPAGALAATNVTAVTQAPAVIHVDGLSFPGVTDVETIAETIRLLPTMLAQRGR